MVPKSGVIFLFNLMNIVLFKYVFSELQVMLAKRDENNENAFLIMKKYRINLTVEDYFDYVGTYPFMSLRDRMLFSLPE